MRSVLTALCLFASTAHAVPAQFTHQGRLLDADGAPLDDEATIMFRVTDSEVGGTALWEETITTALTHGFYSAVLGAREDNPLDTDVLSQAPVWLELQLDGEPAMFPRSAINAVPYATMATVAEEVSGGPVDATEIAVDGTPVVNASGEWVGPAPTVNWTDLEGIPEDFADGVDDDTDTDSFATLGTSCFDGDVPVWDSFLVEWVCDMDQDTLASIDCMDGQLISWSGDAVGWMCADDADTMLSEEDVDAMVSDNGYAMMSEVFSGSFLDLVDVAPDLADGDDDTQLTADEVDAIVADNGYAMATDVFSGSFTALTDVPDGLEDGDDNTQLSEDEVDEMVSDNGHALDSDVAALLAEIETLKDQVETLEEDAETGSGAIMYGNYSVNNSVDLEGLSGFREITGQLYINAGNIPNLTPLESLTTIGGTLTITGNSALTSLAGLDQLTTVGEAVTINGNSSLISLDGINQLESIGTGLDIAANDSLESIEALTGVTEIGSDVYIAQLPELEVLDGLENIEVVKDIELRYLPGLTSLESLSGLHTIDGTLSLYQVDLLSDLSGLEGVTSIKSIYMSENDSISDISAINPATLSSGEWVYFHHETSHCTSDIDVFITSARAFGFSGYVTNTANKSC